LLTGILLSRTFSGILASFLPWKAIYLIAPVLILILTAVLILKMPEDERRSSTLSYWETLKSIPSLIKQQAVLREAAVSGFFMFAGHSIIGGLLKQACWLFLV